MRLSSLFSRYTGNLVVALVTTVVASTARAQLPGIAANGDLEAPIGTSQDSPIEATPEAPVPPRLDGPILERAKLTGDWFGWRTCLQGHGITLNVSTTQSFQGVASGGLEQAFNFGGRNDYFLNLDGEKLGHWTGAFLTLHGETRYGESVSSLAGTLLAPNLFMTVPLPDGSVTALTGVTFTQYFSEEFLAYCGKLNTLDDFEQPLTGATNLTGFQNTAMLYNPVFARTVPYSTLGAGFECLQDEETRFAACVYDTNDSPTTSGFETFFDNGVTVYAELNLSTDFFGHPGHQGISGTYSSGKYTSLTPSAYLDPIEGLIVVPALKAGSWCVAYNVDQALYVSPEDPERMWGVFGNFGIADSNPSPVRWFASAGISGASMLAGRNTDSFGIACFYLGVSKPLRDLSPILLPLRDELGVEMYYNVAITPWCQITPDVQVITPFRERAGTTLLLGLRANVDF